MKSQLLILFALLALSVSCNKDDDNSNNPIENTNNKYTFKGETIKITDAEYYFADGDTYLFFKGEGVDNYVQFILPDTNNTIPTGALTWNEHLDGAYNPLYNFWKARVFNADFPLGLDTVGGSLIITSKPGGRYDVGFSFLTDGNAANDVDGEYVGVLHQRQ